MLRSLAIRDIVLIDRLQLDFSAGLSVLTGETGAGKSILLDSLGLATGARADSKLVRHGTEQGQVVADIDLPLDHEIFKILSDQMIDCQEGQLLLKRIITVDGRSRAFINDQPVSIGLMRQIGDMAVEVHGQHDDRGLLDIAAHRALLDSFGSYKKERDAAAKAYANLSRAQEDLKQAESQVIQARSDEEWLRHAVSELTDLNPVAGEEQALDDKRRLMMQGEKLGEDLSKMMKDLTSRSGVDATVRSVLRTMGRMDAEARKLLDPAFEPLDRAAVELNEAIAALERIQHDIEFDEALLDSTEERLFDLRGVARKYSCQVDELCAKRDELAANLDALDAGEEHVAALKAALLDAEKKMVHCVEALHLRRTKAATALDKGVNIELAPLKLEKASFQTAIEKLSPEHWAAEGGDRVVFEVSTNPGAPFAPMIKVASGGELARFILALKVVLATSGGVPVMVFDEVDRGIGGATADAVGERLSRLASSAQVLVVTHSPQVAAVGDHHFRITKSSETMNGSDVTISAVEQLSTDERREELARMLAGAEVTDAARAAADQLLTRE